MVTKKVQVSFFLLTKKDQGIDRHTQGKEKCDGRGLPSLEIFPVFCKLGEGIVRNRDMTTGFEG